MMNGNENLNNDKMQSDTQILALSQRLGVNSNQQINEQNDYLNGKNNQIGQNNDDQQSIKVDSNLQNRIKKLPSIKADISKFDKKRQQQQVTFQNQSISQSYQQPLIYEQSPVSEIGKKFFSSPKTKAEVGMNSLAESKGQLSMLDELQSPTDSFRFQLNQNPNQSRRNDDQSFTKQQQGNSFSSPVNNSKAQNSPQHNQKQNSNNKQEDLVTAIQNAKVNNSPKTKPYQTQQSQRDQNTELQKSTFFSPRDKAQSSIPRILLQDKKQFLEHEIKEILKRTKKISVTLKYFFFRITCKKLFADDQNILIDKACDRVEEDLDILVLLNRLKDVEKIKEILFDNQQQLLFNFFPKPVIKATGIEEEIPDKKTLLKDAKSQPKKKFKNDLKINIRQLGVVMKAVKKFKEPISKKIMDFDNVDAYQRLFQAYEYVSYKNPNSLMNQKLVNLLGDELKNVFETCKLMEEKQEKYNQQYLETKSNRHIDNKDSGLGSADFNQYVNDQYSKSFDQNGLKKLVSIESPSYSPLHAPIIDLNQDEILSNDQESKYQDQDLDISSIEQSQIRGLSQRIKDQRVRMMTNIKDENSTSNILKAPEIELEMSNPGRQQKDQK